MEAERAKTKRCALREEDVVEIYRSLQGHGFKTDHAASVFLASKYHVSSKTIRDIWNGRCWRRVIEREFSSSSKRILFSKEEKRAKTEQRSTSDFGNGEIEAGHINSISATSSMLPAANLPGMPSSLLLAGIFQRRNSDNFTVGRMAGTDLLPTNFLPSASNTGCFMPGMQSVQALQANILFLTMAQLAYHNMHAMPPG
mmetsp:Transcript_72886/g.194578  ORF Transcript_72886/g.194578 Transcript_72886/m.194578 type:complete len:199 (-) Transcript_72886:161-757(-)|eukprot:CAMPEP_0113698976 /NCGR_PEP_ID=MMETSP0038_2-20120614/23031_1 /TAXON_ID=2898 /ORGANISM="Cryptomonas paramecium" /LENGTH=198 /DNA_ID=CAMNT_0000622243 /DNA_START=60 /DNA_END=656 /DNA_ORIENTATION=- /assembly_acc=CAM_ASM_000170